ncbi:MAG: hypothetical protein V4696_10660 [Pseudomonadota bacterium]
MSTPDPTAVAALQASIVKPVFFAYLDFLGDPVRANTSGGDLMPTGSGDPDLDDEIFTGISGTVVTVSAVKFGEGGSDSVTAELSGIPGVDDDTLALLADPLNYRGRDARLWRIIRNASNVQQGGFHAYYTGKMTSVLLSGGAEEQRIRVTIESYLAALSQPSNRTYMDQTRYDSGDESARAAIAIANGNYTGAPSTGSGGLGTGGSGGAGGERFFNTNPLL